MYGFDKDTCAMHFNERFQCFDQLFAEYVMRVEGRSFATNLIIEW